MGRYSTSKELLDKYRHFEEIGLEVRFDHEECGDTRQRLYVTRTPKGWKHHCHNCAPNMSGFTRSSGPLPPKDTLRILENVKENQVVTNGNLLLPPDFTSDIPLPGLAWLYKYEITDEEIQRYDFGYSPSNNRLVLPVYGADARLCFYQARTLGIPSKSNPKYTNVRSKGRDVYFRRFKDGDIVYDSCCLVEDILSAIKVGRVVQSIGLLGSYIPQSLTSELVKFRRVFIWLDADKWKESVKYAIKLSLQLGIPVVPIYTEKDPKEYSEKDIRKQLLAI